MHKTLAEPFTGAHIHPIPVIDRPDEVPAGQPEAVRTGQHGATEVLHVGCGVARSRATSRNSAASSLRSS